MEKELKEYIECMKEKALRETYVKKLFPKLHTFINEFGKLNNISEKRFSEKVFLYVNGIEHVKKCNCGKETEFLSFFRGYREYCGYKCSNNDITLTQKKVKNYKKSLIKKYGVDNIWDVKDYRDKMKNISDNKDYSSMVNKLKKTVKDKYGVDNISQLDSIKQKKMDDYEAKTGYKNPMFNPKIKEKIKNVFIKNYGVDTPLKNENVLNKLKNTVKDKYGVENVMQSKEVKEIVKKTYLKNWGEEHFIYSEKYQEQRIEKRIAFLNLQHVNLNLTSIVKIFKNNTYGLECLNCNCCFYLSVNAYNIRKNKKFELCTKCNPIKNNKSLGETDLRNYIENLTNIKTEKIRFENKEFDIFMSDKQIGIEYNGIYWHSEFFMDKNKHKLKKDIAKKHNFRLIHVWEDDWNYKQDIVKSMLNNIFQKSNKIYARKCKIKIVNEKEVKQFLNENHLFGWCVSSVKIGLYYNDKLVSLMTFGKKRTSLGHKKIENEFELIRYCNILNHSVIGGASKLLKFFINNYKPTKIISYSQNDYSDGNLYEKIGFKYIKDTEPGYYWIINGIKENRYNWRKDKLIKMGYDPNKTETEIMHELGHWKVWNSGNKLYELNI